jgi:two-component system KDP operon response regulator KdpE
MEGQALLQAIRSVSAVPVIVLSSRSGEFDKVAALDGGADDYITKPFGAEELLARIRAALRHRLHQQGVQPAFESGDLAVDLVHRRVRARGKDVHLSPKEYDLLEQFVLHAGKVLTHRHLLRTVWGRDSADPQYLRVYIRQLRQKLEADPERPSRIVTEPGVGYRLLV